MQEKVQSFFLAVFRGGIRRGRGARIDAKIELKTENHGATEFTEKDKSFWVRSI